MNRKSATSSLAVAFLVLSRLVTMPFAIATVESTPVHAGVPLEMLEQGAGVPTLAPILDRITPAIVTVVIKNNSSAKTRNRSRRNSSGPEIAAVRETSNVGSGVVFDAAQGLIVTNHHVIAHANEITVMLKDGRELAATPVGADAETDLAVIKIQADDLTALPLGASDRIEVGDFVFAIGDPYHLGQSVTSGIVGGLHRRTVGTARYQDFIQTDAAIYPGNSGGALINGRGDLIGINTAFVRPGRDNPGVGFAIPITLVRSVVDEILKYGEIRRGQLGITFDDSDPDRKSSRRQSGVLIIGVDKGSAAERAGLRTGDVMIALDKMELRDASDLENRLGLLRAGDIAELGVVRKGIRMTLFATMTGPVRQAGSK